MIVWIINNNPYKEMRTEKSNNIEGDAKESYFRNVVYNSLLA